MTAGQGQRWGARTSPGPAAAGSGLLSLPRSDRTWSKFGTHDMAQARTFLSTIYRARDVRVTGDPSTFEFSARYQHFELFGVDILQHTGQIHMVSGSTDHIYLTEIKQGRLHVETSAGQLSLEAGGAVMSSVDESPRTTWDNLRMVAVRLEELEVRRFAAELVGVDPTALRFRLQYAASPAHARQWSAAVRYVVQGVLDNPAAVDSTLARRECFRLLATTALEAFPQPDFSVDESRTADATPATIRRAIEFIETNAATDITVADVARVARLSIRGTQAAFRRHLDTSPAAYLRRVRLAAAHRDLVAADPTKGANVADVAARWGFIHLGHFAATYRECYGVLPSQTLNH